MSSSSTFPAGATRNNVVLLVLIPYESTGTPQTSWRSEGYDCVTYIRSTMVGCFCLDAVVSSFKEHGLVEGSKRVAREQGAICTPFLKDYAKANAIKILAVSRTSCTHATLDYLRGSTRGYWRWTCAGKKRYSP